MVNTTFKTLTMLNIFRYYTSPQFIFWTFHTDVHLYGMVDVPVFVVAPVIVVWQNKPQFIYCQKLSNEISSVTESIKFAHLISIQRHDIINDVIMTYLSLKVTAAILQMSER